MNDLLIITQGDWNLHLEQLEIVLECLEKAGLKVDAKKSFVGKAELYSARLSRLLDHQNWHLAYTQASTCYVQHSYTKDL